MAFINDITAKSIIEEIQMTGFYNGKTAKVFHILGRRAGFTSTSVLNDIREFAASGGGATALNPELSNSTLDLISDNAGDDNSPAGIGVRTVKVVYINNSNNLVESADIALNGTVNVVAALTNVNAILWMEATAVGSNLVAVGNITLRVTGGGAICEQITAGGNKSMSARVFVPAGYTGYLTSWGGSAISTTQDLRIRATVNSLDRTLSTVYHFQSNAYLSSGISFVEELPFMKFPQLSRCKVSTISGATAAGNRVDVSFTFVIIEN